MSIYQQSIFDIDKSNRANGAIHYDDVADVDVDVDADDDGAVNERLVKYKERLPQWVISVIAGLRFAQWAHTSELPDERLGFRN